MKITNRDVGWALIFIFLGIPIIYTVIRGNYDLLFNFKQLQTGDTNPGFVLLGLIADVVLFVVIVVNLIEDSIKFEFKIPNPFERHKMTEEEYREFQEWLKKRRE